MMKSTDFSRARSMAMDNDSIPEKSILLKRIWSIAQKGAVELVKEMLPRITELVYSVISGYLTACGLERNGSISWKDPTVHASTEILLTDVHKVWGLRGREMVRNIMDIRKGNWGELIPLIELLSQIPGAEIANDELLPNVEATGETDNIKENKLGATHDVYNEMEMNSIAR